MLILSPTVVAVAGVAYSSLIALAYLGFGRRSKNKAGSAEGVWNAGAWTALPRKVGDALPPIGVRTWRERLGTAIVIGNVATLIWGDRVYAHGVLLVFILGLMPAALVGYTLASLLYNEREERRRAADGLGDGLAALLRSRLSDRGITQPDAIARKAAVALTRFPNWQRDDGQWRAARKDLTFALLTEENDMAKATTIADSLLKSLRR